MKLSSLFRMIPITAVFAILAAACHKSSPAPDPVSASSSFASNSYNGLFDSQLIYSVYGASTFTSPSATDQAYASQVAFSNMNMGPPSGALLNMGLVSLNGITFKDSSGLYKDTTLLHHALPNVWQVSGGDVTAFTYTNTTVFPSITGYIAWPDTIYRSQTLNLSLTGLSGVDELKIFVKNVGSSSQIIVVESPATTHASFLPVGLSALSTTIAAEIRVEAYHNNFQTMGSNKFNFRNTSVYVKTVPVKN